MVLPVTLASVCVTFCQADGRQARRHGHRSIRNSGIASTRLNTRRYDHFGLTAGWLFYCFSMHFAAGYSRIYYANFAWVEMSCAPILTIRFSRILQQNPDSHHGCPGGCRHPLRCVPHRQCRCRGLCTARQAPDPAALSA